jgi:competence protein ComEC
VVFVARTVERWSAGWGNVAAPPVSALLLVTAGFLWLSLWHERWRIAGLLPIILAIPIAVLPQRPDILVHESGITAAVRGADGRLQIVNARPNRFAAEMWLRADADPRPLAEVSSDGVRCDAIGCVASLDSEGDVVAVSLDPAAFADDCTLADIVITRYATPRTCRDRALVIDREALRRGGSHALYRRERASEGTPPFTIETAYPDVRRPFMPQR